MSNLTPEDVNLRLTETRNELQLEDARLWQGLEDERVSRIAGDAANNNLIENTNTALAAQEARLSVEVVQREEGDLRNITSLSELAQALADYRIKTDLELNLERIARQQLGVDLNTRVDAFVATFDHKFLMVYQTIQTYQTSTTASINALDLRVKAYEDMLQDITTDSIQITMDNGEINMGAWTILSQARQWDLEILAKFKDYKTQTSLDIDDALQDIQNQLPVEQNIINSALNALSNSQVIQNLDAAINSNAAGINTLVDDLLQEVSDRQSDMLTLSQNISKQLVINQADLVRRVEAETAARINELQREASIRQQELVNEANERSTEIDEKLHDALGNLNVDLSGVYSEINQVSAALDAEEAARIAAITDLNNGLTHEIQLRQDGDTANLTAINNYKTANDTALANVRSDLQANVTATTANASNITALDARLVANESLAASAVNKAETALTQNSAMASEITSVKASITDLEDSLVDKADANALQLLDSKVTVLDGKVTTNTSDITQLKTNVTTLTNTKADSTALNALTSTVATQGNTITSQSKDISDLTAAISTSVPEIKFTGTQDCINITAAFASNPDVTLVTEPSAVSGKVVRIGNNSGNDQFNGIMNSYVAIDPNKLYRVKYRIRRVLNDAAGMFLSLVQTNATKTFNVMSSNTTTPLTDISDSLYYLFNAKPALDTWFTGEYYFKGKSAGASSGSGTLASPRTFSADAAFFRIGILSNYPAVSGTQDVDYIIVEDYDAMALGNANAAATTALTARVTSAEGTLTSNSTAITQLQNSLTTTNNTVATKADASAVNALDSKVTTIGSNVTSNSNAITQLQNDLTTTNAAVNTKASAAALTALDTKVTSIDGKVTTQSSQITNLNSSLTVTDKLTRLTSQGKPLRDDANFKTSANLIVYGDQEGYTFTRQTITAGNPSGSTHEYRMAMTQAITGIGIGFYPNPIGIYTAANKVFLFKMVLKAPVGAVINIYKSETGTPSTYEMLGNNLGTGKFDTYYFWLQCGPTGTFSTAGHVAITQGTATVGTPSVPFEVTVASYEAWDVTTVDDSIPKIWADKVDANATAVTSLNSQVTSINGTVTSQGSQLTTLTNRVSTVEGSVANKADSSAVSSLDSKVTTIDGKVTQNANAITTLTGRVTTVENGLTNKADSSVLVNYSTKTETNTAIATGIQSYNASLVIGGANLALNTGRQLNQHYWPITTTSPLIVGKEYTLSFDYIGDVNGSIYLNNSISKNYPAVNATTWVRASVTFVFVKNDYRGYELFPHVYGATDLRNLKLEVGNKATDWTPNEQEVQQSINANATAITNTNAEVSRVDGRVTTESNRVTMLTGRVSNVENGLALKADVSALNNIYTKSETDAKATSIAAGEVSAYDANLVIGGANTYDNETTPISGLVGNPQVPYRNSGDTPNGFHLIGDPTGQSAIRLGGVITEAGWWTISFYIRGSQNVPVGFKIDIVDGAQYLVRTTSDNTWKYVQYSSYVAHVDSTYNFIDFSEIWWAYIYLKDIKVERGSKATAWTPSNQHVLGSLSANASAIQTVNAEVSRINGEVVSTANNVNTLTSSVGLLQGSINEVRQTVTNNQESTNTLVTSLRSGMADADDVSMMMRNATAVFEDLSFKNGWNGVQVYNNYANGTLVANFTGKLPDNPVASTRQIEFIHSGGATTPELGGFHQATQSRANGVFLVKFVAKLPVGYSFVLHSNALGDGASSYFIGSSEGTGKYKTYYGVYRCGATGTFSTLGFVAVNGPHPTPENPLIWHLASSTVYDCLDSKIAPDSVVNGIAEAKTIASTAVNKSDAAAILAQNLQASLDNTNANISNNYYTKSSTDEAISNQITNLSATLDMNTLPSKRDTTKANQWLLTHVIPKDAGWVSGGVKPDFSTLKTGIKNKRIYCTDGNTQLSSSEYDNTALYFRTIVYVYADVEVNLGNFIGDDAHSIYVNGVLNFTKDYYGSTGNLRLALKAGLNTIDVICYNGGGNAGFFSSVPLSSLVVNMYAPESVEEQAAATANAVSSLTTAVSNIDGRVSSQAIQLTTLESSKSAIENGAIAGNNEYIVDLRDPAYNRDLYYPVLLSGFSTEYRQTIRVMSTLNGASVPPWAYHGGGFALNAQFQMGGAGWGTINPEIVTDNFIHWWTHGDISPLDEIGQISESSQPFFYVRGGGYYRLSKPVNRSVQVCAPNGSVSGYYEGTLYPRPYQASTVPKSINQDLNQQNVKLQQTNAVIDGVKAVSTVSVNNNGFISGYGLISQLVNGVVQSAFGVNADYFYVGTSTSNQKKPFMVLTSSQTIDGVTYPAGTWMDVALIANATIGTAHIADASITNAKIASLDAGKITAGTLDANRIAANTITADKISVNSLSAISANLGTIKVGTANIDNAAVTTAKIGDAQITSAKIDNLAVTTGKIQDLAVDTIKIKDQAITVGVGVFGTDRITITTSGGIVRVEFNFTLQGETSDGSDVWVSIRRGGTIIRSMPFPYTQIYYDSSSYAHYKFSHSGCSIVVVETIPAGTHTYTISGEFVGSIHATAMEFKK